MASKVRFGIIGCGAIGPTHAGALRQIADAELVAVADPVRARAEAVAAKYAVARVYDTHEALLADAEVDAVCVCTPSGLHARHGVAALQARKHVLLEKPMEISLAACDALIDAADRAGKKLAVVSQHRWDAASQAVKAVMDRNALGTLVLAEASVPWYRTQDYYDSGDWRGTWESDGGGALMNQGVHTVDVLQWLAGGVASVFAQTRTRAHARIAVEDVAVATLAFDNGAVGTLTATTAAWEGFPVRIALFGTEGTAIIEGDRLKTLVLKSGERWEGEAAASHALSVARGGTASVKEEAATRLGTEAGAASRDPGAVWGDAHRAQIEDFIHAIQTGGTPLIDGREGRKPVALILGVYRAAQTGQPITLG